VVTHDPEAASRAHRLVRCGGEVLRKDVRAERRRAVDMAAVIPASST
jgi:hypothetical protein